MRWLHLGACICLVAQASLAGKGPPSAAQPDEPEVVEEPEAHDTEKPPPRLPPFELFIDRNKVDLDKGRLELRMTRKAGHVVLKLYDGYGAPLGEVDQEFRGRPAGSTLTLSFTKSGEDPIGRLEVYAYDAYGFYKAVALVPWYFEVPHEEVTFETDSAEIRESEVQKLKASLKTIEGLLEKHKLIGKISLYIAGHTDTQGSASHNAELSRRRARAIASWFKRHGLGADIAYEGFGEASLRVKTADEVDEPRNRRVDYVLSVEEPLYKNSKRRPAWKRP